ncbi:MAG: hypothetical protein HC880_09610, partial [Bacteroidia bacterium]|nr:hypothetical protein [Bacteroidia bacterium]
FPARPPKPKPPGPDEIIVFPPDPWVDELYNQVDRGHIQGIHQVLDNLVAESSDYLSFVSHLRNLVQEFKLKQVKIFSQAPQ